MGKEKKKIALYFNIVIIILELISIKMFVNHYGLFQLAYYTTISNYIALAASCLYVFSCFTGSLKRLAVNCRFIASMMLTVTFLIVTLVLVWFADPVSYLFTGSALFRHIIVPILSFISYVFFEEHIEKIWEIVPCFIVSLIYTFILVTMNAMGIVEGPYPFFMVLRFGWGVVILGCAGILLAMVPIAWFFYKAPFKKKH